ncbi:MAG: hypothetical protein K2W78_05880 [Xanthobacteraceae bacterium]|nr:hypothetical protein [Xanthobacteraceae bacterium]
MDEKYLKLVSTEKSTSTDAETEQGLRLAKAFFRISDANKRQEILDLAERYAELSSGTNHSSS